MNVTSSDRLLRAWNSAALVFVALLAAIPRELLPEAPPSSPGGYIFSAIGAILLGGFWLRTLWECVFTKNMRHRSSWLVLFVILPIFSAFIYFATSRSLLYEASVRQARVE